MLETKSYHALRNHALPISVCFYLWHFQTLPLYCDWECKNKIISNDCFNFFPAAMSFLSRLICFLDATLCSVGENAGGIFGYLKLFGIKLGIDITELFEMSWEPIVPADHLKVICYAGIVVLLCYFGMSKKTSSVAHRLSGIAVLSAIVHFFWIILSPMSYSYFLCFVFVSGFLIGAASKNTS